MPNQLLLRLTVVELIDRVGKRLALQPQHLGVVTHLTQPILGVLGLHSLRDGALCVGKAVVVVFHVC